MRKKLFISFTMDVERIASESISGGPISWALSEESIKSYADVLNKKGLVATYFAVPYVAKIHADLFKNLIRSGNEVGLHFHYCSFKDNYKITQLNEIDKIKSKLRFSSEIGKSKSMKKIYKFINSTKIPLGLLSGNQQYIILKEAIEDFKNYMNFKPKVFRPGFFSLNDESYPQLIKLGFKAGSTSLLGRHSITKFGVSWRHSRRDTHKVNEKCKNKKGDLDFVEIPATTHVNHLGFISRHGDIRIERLSSSSLEKYLLNAIKQSINWQKKHKSPIFHLLFFTHNTSIFKNATRKIEDNANDSSKLNISSNLYKGGILEKMINIIFNYGNKNDFQLIGASLLKIRECFLASSNNREKMTGCDK
ncbi:MAG: hypothetical protein ACTSRZ_19670 [Promethearchaeota archaeon]